MAGVSTLLVRVLDELEENDVKRFKWFLGQDMLEGFRHIPRGQLEQRDVMGTADLMVERYGGEGALRITLHILRKMDQNRLAGRLEQEEEKVAESGMTSTPKGQREPHDSDDPVKRAQVKLKSRLRKSFEFVYEGIAQRGHQVSLDEVYTELYITEGESGGMDDEHEMRRIETASKTQPARETLVSYNDIFRSSPDQSKPIRTVMTKGIAGIGKTISVQKFVLDWAAEKANEDIDFLFMLPFRELNLLIDKSHSLQELVRYFHPEVNELERVESGDHAVLFIFDGLDESRLLLDFERNRKWFDVKEETSLDVLLTNLIAGNLFRSALVWITTRPAAANQIPHECVQRVTEVLGFNDLQKEVYFSKRFADQKMADSVIKHIKSTRSLHVMCHIPIFCWIAATVLKRIFGRTDSENFPKSLTQLYTNFLLILLTKTGLRHPRENESDGPLLSDKDIVLRLGELAFRHLEKGNVTFYEQDLGECGISARDTSRYLGLITEMHNEDSVVSRVSVYRFIHLSVQEYLAALFVFLSFKDGNGNPLDNSVKSKLARMVTRGSLSDLHRVAIDKAVQSKNGHLDLFLRFLLGISMDSNQSLLRGLAVQRPASEAKTAEDSARYIKRLIGKESCPERAINLFHCLNELNDGSIVQEIQSFLSQGRFPDGHLSSTQCSALTYVMLMSDEELCVLDMKKYKTTQKGLMRLIPVVKYCRGALLDGCNLSLDCCEVLASALSSEPSNLRELDLSNNDLGDTGAKMLSAGLRSKSGKLQVLRLDGCNLSLDCCEVLASALSSEPSNLRELDLSNNDLGDTGAKILSAGLRSPHCKLQALRLGGCGLTSDCCESLASVLLSSPSHLVELDLRDNDLRDAGTGLLSAGLGDPLCTLEKLTLSLCGVRDDGCDHLTAALHSNPSHLRELDLSYNYPGEPALALLSKAEADPSYKLEILLVDCNGVCRNKQRLLKYACALTLDPDTVPRSLSISERGTKMTPREGDQPYINPSKRPLLGGQAICREALSGRCYWEAEWSTLCGRLGVAYKGINANSLKDGIGENDKSWMLQFYYTFYSSWHNKQRTFHPNSHLTSRVGVYLDWPSGTLSFYSVSAETLSLLDSFRASFTEPLYATVGVSFDHTVSLGPLG